MTRRRRFEPQWRTAPPAPGSYRAVFKWGAPDGFKHPNRGLYALLKERLALSDDDFCRERTTGDRPVRCRTSPALGAGDVAALKRIVGPANLAVDDFSRLRYGTGQTQEEIMTLRRAAHGPLPDAVVHPRNTAEVRALVALCHERPHPAARLRRGQFGDPRVAGGARRRHPGDGHPHEPHPGLQRNEPDDHGGAGHPRSGL